MFYEELPNSPENQAVREELQDLRSKAQNLIDNTNCHESGENFTNMEPSEKLSEVEESITIQQKIHKTRITWKQISGVLKSLSAGLGAISQLLPRNLKTYAVIGATVLGAAVTIGDFVAGSIQLEEL